MGGVLLQLVAYGTQDIYLTGNPQITFFKIVCIVDILDIALWNVTSQTINGSSIISDTYVTAGSVTISRNGEL